MKNTVVTFFLAGVMALVSLGASAQENPNGNPEAYKAVVSSLQAGSSPADIINTLRTTHNMNLDEATVFAMVAGGEENRTAFATAGIEAADTLAQAQAVAYAILATAGRTGKVADAVDMAMNDFKKHMGQPTVHEDDYSPTGGGISPA